ncbi:uncharacterized protein EAE98_010350 [Botrytis deweyae]|uniref:Secreted protein n=1 Tax=Botrytis deweyae TaxID=2478750 RepID=A0ABQ7I9M2_9HELO|nr:uncharacterized protein EAE98_010350 [Botrytis deweyae]KAF7917245.1 hypothetical protein EAE98_010350 [Botrytis deweyae]
MLFLVIDLLQSPLLRFFTYVILAFTLLFTCLFRRAGHPLNAPQRLPVSKNYPILGAVRFFTARWEFFREGMRGSRSGNCLKIKFVFVEQREDE